MIRAPGRINLIGEHTDYNDGWVMPAAIDLDARVAAVPRSDRRIELTSAQFPDRVAFALDDATPRPGHWSAALRGVACLLDSAAHGKLRGADLRIDSDIPVGAGLSSSAAVEVAVGFALARLAGIEIALTDLALLCQRASHLFAGTRCGIMDQFIACHGRAAHALQLDTRNLQTIWLPLPDDLALVVCDTGVKHDHAANEYNQRRAECESAARKLGVASLRDLTLERLESAAAALSSTEFHRARHVVTENRRVESAADALRAADYARLGALLNASHASLRDDYAVSCPELDLMADLCRDHPAVYGARLIGGGFGGCVLALARPPLVPALLRHLGPRARLCRTASGVGEDANRNPSPL